MNNAALSALLCDCADELQEWRKTLPLNAHVTYDRLKTLERRAREAAQEVIKSRELNPIDEL